MHELLKAVWISLRRARCPQYLVLDWNDHIQCYGQQMDKERSSFAGKLWSRYVQIYNSLCCLHRGKYQIFLQFLTCANEDVNWDVVEHSLLYWMLRVHFIKVLSGQGCGWVLHGWWRCSCQQRVQEINSERFWCCRWRTSWFGANRRRQAHQMKPKASPLSLVEIRDYQMPDIAVSLT